MADCDACRAVAVRLAFCCPPDFAGQRPRTSIQSFRLATSKWRFPAVRRREDVIKQRSNARTARLTLLRPTAWIVQISRFFRRQKAPSVKLFRLASLLCRPNRNNLHIRTWMDQLPIIVSLWMIVGPDFVRNRKSVLPDSVIRTPVDWQTIRQNHISLQLKFQEK